MIKHIDLFYTFLHQYGYACIHVGKVYGTISSSCLLIMIMVTAITTTILPLEDLEAIQ